MEFLADGSWTKRFQTGWAACAGLHAAALAQAGFSGPATILEGRFGFLHAYSDGATTAPLAAREGYELMRTSVKPHACCRYMQGPIDAVLALRAAHRIEPAEVERVEVGMLAAGIPIVCEPAEASRRPPRWGGRRSTRPSASRRPPPPAPPPPPRSRPVS